MQNQNNIVYTPLDHNQPVPTHPNIDTPPPPKIYNLREGNPIYYVALGPRNQINISLIANC